MSGCKVADGYGTMLVSFLFTVCVLNASMEGMHSYFHLLNICTLWSSKIVVASTLITDELHGFTIWSISNMHKFLNAQVTAVGINTEWGLLMASISEDSGEETPLQVWFFNLLTFARVHELTWIYCSGVGSLERCCHLHWNGWTFCCSRRSCCPSGQVEFAYICFNKMSIYLYVSLCFPVGTSLGIPITLMGQCNMWKEKWV